MGYVRKKILKLVFADPEFEGLEVRAWQASIGQLIRWTELTNLADAGARQQMREVIELLTDGGTKHPEPGLIDWNVESPDPTGDTTVPVPCTAEGMWAQDQRFLFDIARAWMSGSAGVSGPLAPSSTGGKPSPEASIPMETGSSSPPSSTPPD